LLVKVTHNNCRNGSFFTIYFASTMSFIELKT